MNADHPVEHARVALRRHVLEPLVSRCIDQEYGGFLVDFDGRWRPVGPHDKTLEHAARTTNAFALIENAMPGGGLDKLIRHGCAFLQEVMWDATYGGFFAKVDRGGRPYWDGLKHPHAVTYAAQAFLSAAPYLRPGEGRSWAQRTLAWLDDVAWDRAHGGYWGSFRRNNERYPDGARLPTPDGRDVLGVTPGFKESNTLGDAIEMLTAFVAHGFAGQCADRLAFLVALVVDRLTDASGVLPYLYRRDWRSVPDVVRIGQNFQMSHRLMAAADLTVTPGTVARSCEISDFCLAFARHPHGGFCFAVSADGRTWPATSPTTDQRMWWVQLEAVRALHTLATHDVIDRDTGARYRQARDQQWAFIVDRLFDNRYGGIWEFADDPKREPRAGILSWLKLRSPGHRRKIRKMHGWKDPSHEVAAFLILSGALPAFSTKHSVMHDPNTEDAKQPQTAHG